MDESQLNSYVSAHFKHNSFLPPNSTIERNYIRELFASACLMIRSYTTCQRSYCLTMPNQRRREFKFHEDGSCHETNDSAFAIHKHNISNGVVTPLKLPTHVG